MCSVRHTSWTDVWIKWKKRYHRALCFIDRNCCSPKGRGTLIIKNRQPEDITLTIKSRCICIRSRHWLLMTWWNKFKWKCWYIYKKKKRSSGINENKCLMSSCAYSKTVEHVISKKTYIEEIAQAWPLFVSSPSFASLSLCLRHLFTFNYNEN